MTAFKGVSMLISTFLETSISDIKSCIVSIFVKQILLGYVLMINNRELRIAKRKTRPFKFDRKHEYENLADSLRRCHLRFLEFLESLPR